MLSGGSRPTDYRSVKIASVAWLPWILLEVGLGVVGLTVLGALAVRVLTAVRALGKEVERTKQELEPKLAEFERVSERVNGSAR